MVGQISPNGKGGWGSVKGGRPPGGRRGSASKSIRNSEKSTPDNSEEEPACNKRMYRGRHKKEKDAAEGERHKQGMASLEGRKLKKRYKEGS